MGRLQVAVIVEGYGEVSSIRILLERIWRELLEGDYIHILKPIRQSRSQLIRNGNIQAEKIQNVVGLAAGLLNESRSPMNDPTLVLILLDADDDCPKDIGPRILQCAKDSVPSQIDIDCVLANIEFETWFIEAADSLSEYFDLGDVGCPDDPEGSRLGKGWIKKRFLQNEYSETQDQPALTKAMNLEFCRARSPSFDKLCRVLEKRRVG